MLTPRQQGDFGELSAMCWLARRGAQIWLPVGTHPDCDVIAQFGERLLRVQVKTSNCFVQSRWNVTLCTRGGNQSWTGLAKTLDPDRFDYLFVHVGDGRRWFIPSRRLRARSSLRLGGPKYAEFEVAGGDAIPKYLGSEAATTIGAPDRRGDVRAAKGDAL
jgi:PD-(D/E)XK endonuclease